MVVVLVVVELTVVVTGITDTPDVTVFVTVVVAAVTVEVVPAGVLVIVIEPETVARAVEVIAVTSLEQAELMTLGENVVRAAGTVTDD